MRKKTKVFLTMTALVIVLISLGTASIAKSEVSTAQQKAEAFTENVLPIDKSQYNITLDGYFVSYPPDIKDRELNNYKQEHYRYSLASDESDLSVSYTVENDVLKRCVVTIKRGQVLTDRPYSNLNDAVIGFLERYQTYKAADTSEMKYMAQNTDLLKNQTLIAGDLKLKISNGDYPFSGHKTSLMWYRVINGCEYLELSLSFTDGIFTGFSDISQLYPIGNTSVNISKDQAIEIAMKYIQENYTYEMPGNVWVKGFNVNQSLTTAVLSPTVRDSNEQYPVWSVMFTLDHTYPGSVVGLHVIISADSGEVLLCSNQATGGSIESSDDTTIILPSQSPISSSSTAPDNTVSSDNNMTTTIVAVIAIVVALALIALFVKKRSK
ncbi:MAG: hypothetical protein GX799_10600 [Crenarchaeota archaeon]|nr:hypothetical protein [Thermoproteota archaeon]